MKKLILGLFLLSICLVSCQGFSHKADQIATQAEETLRDNEIAKIIREYQNVKLYEASASKEELAQLQFAFLDTLTRTLDEKYNGYRYTKEDIMESDASSKLEIQVSLIQYNWYYALLMSKYNPELEFEMIGNKPSFFTHPENEQKVNQLCAVMLKMELDALTDPDGFNSEADSQ